MNSTNGSSSRPASDLQPGDAWTALGLEAGLIPLAFLLGWLLGQPALETLHLRAVDAGLGALAALPMVGVFLLIVHYPGRFFEPVMRFTREILMPTLAPLGPAGFVLVALLAGFGEEMLFRGVIQEFVARSWALWPAVVLAAVLFGAMHAVTFDYAVLTFGFGLWLGAIQAATGNLMVPIVAHFLYDLVVLLYLRVIYPSSPPASSPRP